MKYRVQTVIQTAAYSYYEVEANSRDDAGQKMTDFLEGYGSSVGIVLIGTSSENPDDGEEVVLDVEEVAEA